MKNYEPKKIEKNWQEYWEENKTFEVNEDSKKQKFYGLVEFPYPSGAGLHVGHPRPFTAMDVICRKKRMEGFNVLYPMGFDAFGLPTENFAIKTGRPPAEVTAENIANFTRQLKMLGYSFDWSRVVDTTDPKYFKWTQWIFLQLFKHGLAYKKGMPINWCPSCKIGLANEEVVDSKCERCGTPVEKRNKEQWMLAITKYADKLLAGLETVDYIPQAKIQQQNWIGRSEGATVKFNVIARSEERATKQSQAGVLEVFTTRPDTLFGVTYMVIAPEHELIMNNELGIKNYDEVKNYIEQSKKKSEQERADVTKEKTGVELKGIKAINPVNNEELPIFVADYVLGVYGTGAIMAVPAHDERDWEFAKKFNLEIKQVLEGGSIKDEAFVGDGKHVNSEFLNGLDKEQGIEAMNKWLEEKGIGKRKVQFKLRDWVFSRQRYWGEPIPLVYCENCKNKKFKYILLHGYKGQDNFIPYLKAELEKMGHEVYAPLLPNPNKPNVEEQVDFVLKNTLIDENTVIMGVSLGGAVAMKIAEQAKKTLGKLVLVDSFIKPEFTDNARPDVENSFNWKFDFNKIAANAKKIILLADKNFSVVAEWQAKEMEKLLKANLIFEIPEADHFQNNGPEPTIFDALQETGWVPLPESELPLELPKVEKYEPTDNGESPLAHIDKWVKTKCPVCGGPARRETDTMPNWAGSSWYFLAYTMPRSQKSIKFIKSKSQESGEFIWDRKAMDYWNPVDWYNGGMEHTVLHLLYSRFWNEFLYDIGVVPTSEPYKKRTSHGMILAPDGEKMSKSRGNVINPDEMVERFGTDAFRMYIMFMGPFDQAVAWDTNGLVGVRRFLEKVWLLSEKVVKDSNEKSLKSIKSIKSKVDTLLQQTIKKVSEDIEAMRFNTAVAQLMILVNEMSKEEQISPISYLLFLQLLSPFAPHISEELWSMLGNKESIAFSEWPKYDPELAKSDTFTLAVQVNGKLRDTLEVAADISETEAKEKALESENVKKWLVDKEPKKVIYVKGKLVSIVV